MQADLNMCEYQVSNVEIHIFQYTFLSRNHVIYMQIRLYSAADSSVLKPWELFALNKAS